MFEVDEDGELFGVNFSPQFEGPLETRPELIKPFYEAYVKWHEVVKNPIYLKEKKLREGDIITFNNRRIFHARKGFPPQEKRLLMVSHTLFLEFSHFYQTGNICGLG